MGMIIAKYQNKTSRLWGKDCTGSVMGPGRLQLSNGEATIEGGNFVGQSCIFCKERNIQPSVVACGV